MAGRNLAPRRVNFRGTKYRSIIEARTAVFFSYAGIAYQYEPKPIKLSNGKFYLPDFYLAEFDAYVEVKPVSEVIRDVERHKADLLAASGETVWLTRGHPRFGVPWFEDIGTSKLCMIANDATNANAFWSLLIDSKRWVPLGCGTHERPCDWRTDNVIRLALSQCESFEPDNQELIRVGETAKMVFDDAYRRQP